MEQVRATVAEIEATTSGEIVPIVWEVSADYSWIRVVLAFWGAVVAFATVEVHQYLSSWPLSLTVSGMIIGAGAALGFGLAWIPAVARRAIGHDRMDEAASLRAAALFLEHGVGETRDRTGVLVYISKFEHEIVILADKGIHSKVSEGYWKGLCDEFVGQVKTRGEIETLCDLIRKIGGELSKHFPRSAQDRNELHDELRGKS